MSADTIVFVVVVASRFVVPLLIPRYPLPAIMCCALIDACDQSIFKQFTHVHLSEYQAYDKALDVFYLSVAYVSTLRNWVSGDLVRVATALWYFRLIGVVLFEFTGERWLLVVFANTFEYFFIAVEWFRLTRDPRRLSQHRIVRLVVGIWILIKIPQELELHVARWDLTDRVKRYLLGVPVDSQWSTALAHRPLVTGALFLLSIGSVVLVISLSRNRPDGDWRRTVDSDVVAEHLGWDPPSRVVRPTATFGWSFLEKTSLACLVGMTFANLLPVIRVEAEQLVVGTIVVIVVNTLLSEFLNERRITMRTIRVLYVFMVLVNTATVAMFYGLLGGDENKIHFVNTLFFVVLLTLIIVLFDRYRQVSRLRRQPTFILPM